MNGRASQSRQPRQQKSPVKTNRVLGAELLEAREMLSGSPWLTPLSATVKATPAVSKVAAAVLNASALDKTASLSVLGIENGSSAGLTYTWSVTTLPSGAATPTFSVNGSSAAQNDTITFGAAGTYGLSVKISDAAGASVTSTTTLTVQSVLSSIAITTPNGTPTSATAALAVTTATQGLTVNTYDQFGKLMTASDTYTWSATMLTVGGSETFSANGSGSAKSTTVSFNKAGSYALSVKAVDPSGANATATLSLAVKSALTSMSVSPTLNGLSINGTSQAFTVSAYDQFHNSMTPSTSVWSVTLWPNGAATPTFTVSGGATTVTFHKAGVYSLSDELTDANGLSLTASGMVTVNAVASSLSVTPATSGAITGTSQTFTVNGVLDQFGNALATQPALAWSALTLPSGAAAPTFTVSGKTAVCTFSQVGTYSIKVSAANVSTTLGVTVSPTLTSIVVTPGTANVATGGTQSFAAQGFDQFKKALASQPSFTWSTSSGSISSSGLLTAPAAAGSLTVKAASGSVSGTASVTVTASNNGGGGNNGGNGVVLNLQNKALSTLVTSLDNDGSISRNDMIQILQAVDANGTVTASEMSDLNTILNSATALNMAGYVEVLAADVVDGNPANAHYQGQTLGNLAAGSSAAQLTDLIGKWFLGADLPTTGGYSYALASGSLFGSGPTYTNAQQGMLGDCYFISSLGSIAKSNPAAIENMFINNGDGTYTVRFYNGTPSYSYQGNGTWSDGFSGTADYVTVNLMLPVNSAGQLVFDGYGNAANSSSNVLWIELAEKAYAQWNETGRTWRSGSDLDKNSYTNIQGGWMPDVYSQVLGVGCTEYDQVATNQFGATAQQAMINALAANEAVSIGTDGSGTLAGGLYNSHAYAVTGYNASNGTFTLYNPWGFDQPTPLTWAQIQSSCDGFAIVNTAGSQPISTKPSAVAAAGLHAGLPESALAAAPDAVLAGLSGATLSDWGPAAAGHAAADAVAAAHTAEGTLAPAATGSWHSLFGNDWSWLPATGGHQPSANGADLSIDQIDQAFHDSGLEAVNLA